MKKAIAVLLAVMLTIGVAVPAFAQEETKIVEAESYTEIAATASRNPIIFVTGIGQTRTHLLNDDGSYKTDSDGNIIEYNLFYPDFNYVLKHPTSIINLLGLVGQILLTFITNRNCVDSDNVTKAVQDILRCNIVDDEGKLPAEVEDTIKKRPVSEYNELDEINFFKAVPCADIIDQIGRQNVFCFNYSSFSYLYDDADLLNDFIKNTVLGKYFPNAEQVVLVPMSMGASVVSAYLDVYGNEGDVSKVVSVVGAWNGSDVFADLIEGEYAENSAELLYNGLLSDMVGEPWGYLVNIVLRFIPKATARSLIDEILDCVKNGFILKTTSLLALIPNERYEAIETKYLAGDEWAGIREQTRRYYNAQRNLKSKMADLETRFGTEFYFISGYGLGFGEFSSDYHMFQFLANAATTNSDEIIQISSTAPGTTFAAAGEELTRDCYASDADYNMSQSRYISPDKSIDLSTSFYPDRTWCFYRQKHELEYNNTTLSLAFKLAIGQISGVRECADIYPQFNESRDVKALVRGDGAYKLLLENYITENASNPDLADNVAIAQKALNDSNAMLNRTINNREEDDKVIAAARAALEEIGVFEKSEPDSGKPNKFNEFMKNLNDKVYNRYGAKGFSDYDWFGTIFGK